VSLTTAIVIILILAVIFFFARSKGSESKPRSPAARPVKTTASSEFHAVSIRFLSSACSAAKSLDGKRFLSSAAPRIPLAECDVLECKCRFVHYSDRREGDDRRNPYSPGIAGETGKHPQEQRRRPERRKDPDPF
jgi:hypothetical protein